MNRLDSARADAMQKMQAREQQIRGFTLNVRRFNVECVRGLLIVSTRQHISKAQTGDIKGVDSIQAGTKADMARELLITSGQSAPSLTAEKN